MERREEVDIDRVYLNEKNLRYDTLFKSQEEAIEYLCRDAKVLQLARNIAKNGLNPLEQFALVAEKNETYVVAEGNRRLCALKLLIDPDNAPADQRKAFIKSAEAWTPISKLPSIIFNDHNDKKLRWLISITHSGENGGRGRISWGAIQKARFMNAPEDRPTLIVLDEAEKQNLIEKKDCENKFFIVKRYLSNAVMGKTLGLCKENGVELGTTLSESDFSILFHKFINDIKCRNITTRTGNNKEGIEEYARKLGETKNVTGKRVDCWDVTKSTEKPKKQKKPDKKKPPSKIVHCKKLYEALEEIPSHKLSSIYNSLCSVHVRNHTPLLTVGAWSFIETLTVIHGKDKGAKRVTFPDFLNKDKLGGLGIEKERHKEIDISLRDIHQLGNATKHATKLANFNDRQLISHFDVLEELFLVLAKRAKGDI